jgi:hypothetical protein
MITIISVALFAIGVALLMQSSDFLLLHRLKILQHRQGREGAKSVFFVVAGILVAASGLVMFVLHAIWSD